ncbi:MAG: hypothetical protein ABIH72_03980 [archaeon]
MLNEILNNIVYFIYFTIKTDLLWVVFPLFLATVVMLFYFEKYRDEKPGWNTYVANSLVLLFVAMIMFKQIYSYDSLGAINFILFPLKFILALIVLFIGIIVLFLNFEHFLPEKLARYISSPLTLNLIAYILVLYVYSGIKDGWSIFFSLLILFIILIIIFNTIRILMRKIFLKLKKMKEKEKLEEIIDGKNDIKRKKQEVKKFEKKIKVQAKKIKQVKKEVKKEEKKLKDGKLKELDKEKKQAIKLKKIIKKPIKK